MTAWSDCQSDCSGLKTREVTCVSDEAGQKKVVGDSECAGARPQSALPCSRHNCPSWSAGAWSGCSVTCGLGVKQRSVSCTNQTGDLSHHCRGEKPAETEVCHSKCTSVPAVRTTEGGWQRVSNETQEVQEDLHTILIRDQYSDDADQEEELEEEDATHREEAEKLKNIIGTNPK